jgi:hypothetical protein
MAMFTWIFCIAVGLIFWGPLGAIAGVMVGFVLGAWIEFK